MKTINFGDINKVILFGGGSFLVEAAQKFKKEGWEVVVFSAPRHLKEVWGKRSLVELLRENGIAFFETDDINTDKSAIEHISGKTMGISLGAAWIFKEKFIERFHGKLLNMHGARLPQNRGGGGFSWQILMENKLGCCLIHQVSPGIDDGDIIKCTEFVYPSSCRVPRDFMDYQFRENIVFFDEFLSQVKKKSDFNVVRQPEHLSTYWPRLNTEQHAYIDWSWSLKHVASFIDAFGSPYRGAATFVGGRKVFLKECSMDHGDGAFHPFQQGLIFRKTGAAVFIAANEGTLVINSVLDEKGKDFLSKLHLGDRFFTPSKYLEDAKLFKAVYTAKGLRLKKKK